MQMATDMLASTDMLIRCARVHESGPNSRWKANITYRDGSEASYWFQEFENLGSIIEQGPDWNDITRFEIVLHHRSSLEERGLG